MSKIRYVSSLDGGTELSHPFPEEPLTFKDQSSEIWWSPPVQSGKKAFRYRAWRTLGENGRVNRYLTCEVTEGWAGYISRENWAARTYMDDKFGTEAFCSKGSSRPPWALYLKWYGDAARFLYHDAPKTLESHLKEFEHDLDQVRLKAKIGQDAKKQHFDTFGKPRHGDLVVTARPAKFKSYGSVQHFVMMTNSKGRLATYLLRGDVIASHCLEPVKIRGYKATDFKKVGQASLETINNISAHEKLRLLTLAADIRAAVDRGELTA